jgi:hypothetical protein
MKLSKKLHLSLGEHHIQSSAGGDQMGLLALIDAQVLNVHIDSLLHRLYVAAHLSFGMSSNLVGKLLRYYGLSSSRAIWAGDLYPPLS